MVKVVRMTKTGGPEVLEVVDADVGKPGPGQVLLRHTAIGVNFIDTYQRAGLYKMPLPYTPGSEGAGIVEEVGEGVTGVKAGDRVGYPSIPGGGYAEKRLAPADRLLKLPASMNDKSAAAVLNKAGTVQVLIRRCVKLEPGETILVHAAAGGIGTILCQWASALGVTVIGTAGSAEKVALAKSNGATHCINYRTEDFVARVKEITNGTGVDVAYDSVGKDTWPGTLDCLKKRGRCVVFGQSSGPIPPFDISMLVAKGSLWLTRMGYTQFIATRPELEATMKEVFEAIEKGIVRVKPSQEFPLVEAAAAHRAIESRATTGSTILIP